MANLNNLIVTGTSRFLNKINGACTNGTTISSQSQSTKFLREDGTWAAPSYTTNTNNAVTQTATDSTNATYELLFSSTADNTTRTEGARKSSLLTFTPKSSEVQLTMNYDGSRPNNYGDIKINGNNDNDSCITLHSSSAGMSYMWIKHPTPGVGIFLEGGSDSSSEYSKGTINTDDFIVSGYDWEGNNITWDGTNTSLKAAVTAAKGTVTQTETTTSGNYELLFSGTGDDTTRTEGARKSSKLKFDPTNKSLNIVNEYNDTNYKSVTISPTGVNVLSAENGVHNLIYTADDIVFSAPSNPPTWDGTNTSLKTAVSSKLNKAGDTMTGALTFNKVSNAIHYTGSKADYTMIQFIDNTSDTYGNGIAIGGGGQTIIGGGESASVMKDNAGTAGAEDMWIGNDGDVNIYTNIQPGWASRKTFTFNSAGNLTLPGDLITSTWDGTNTSLKTALANKISKETNTTVSWTSSATGRTVTCMLAKIGTIVICTITGSTDAKHSITAWSQTQLGAGQIPAGYRPSSAMEGRISTQTGGAVVTVNTVGTVAITTWSNLGNQMAFGGTFWWKTS